MFWAGGAVVVVEGWWFDARVPVLYVQMFCGRAMFAVSRSLVGGLVIQLQSPGGCLVSWGPLPAQ